jgi:hypothetical protein
VRDVLFLRHPIEERFMHLLTQRVLVILFGAVWTLGSTYTVRPHNRRARWPLQRKTTSRNPPVKVGT